MADGLISTKLDVYNDAGFVALAGTHVSLHDPTSGDPGSTGLYELSTSGTGYARQAVTLGASSGGAKANTNALTFGPNIAVASWKIMYYGLWTAVTAGTFLGYWTLRDAVGTKLVAYEEVATAASAVFAIGELTFTVVNA